MTGQTRTKWNTKVARVRPSLKAGFCDDAILRDILGYRDGRCVNAILADIEGCRIGEGNEYQNLVAELLTECFVEVVDAPLVTSDFHAEGGRGDIELPLRTERLGNYHLWSRWQELYDIISIIVETKNQRRKATVRDVAQTKGYLDVANRGRFGMLISRSGFSANAIVRLGAIAFNTRHLILPLAHSDLRYLAHASLEGSDATMELLRRKATWLIQAA